jgi:A/G-specific adenine glycosylase
LSGRLPPVIFSCMTGFGMNGFPHPAPGFHLPPTDDEITLFRRIILGHYREHGRDLPWRTTRDPYRILVSEIMLQQTQVDRVLNKYKTFVERFPDYESLARAPQREVLEQWQGLGYNRRCLALHRTAAIIVNTYSGRLPRTNEELRALPGIGPATAAALVSFVYNRPSVLIETNIRNVFIYFFWPGSSGPAPLVSDREILPLIELTLDRSNPRTWYYALMDYGSALKKTPALKQACGSLNERSLHYTKQSVFKGSDRQARGELLRLLLEAPDQGPCTLGHLAGQLETRGLSLDRTRIRRILGSLERDGFISKVPGGFILGE